MYFTRLLVFLRMKIVFLSKKNDIIFMKNIAFAVYKTFRSLVAEEFVKLETSRRSRYRGRYLSLTKGLTKHPECG